MDKRGTHTWDEVIKLIAETVSQEMTEGVSPAGSSFSIPVEVSNRHCHLRQVTFELLYGQGRQLTPMRHLSQPGEFASQEKVVVVGSGMRVLEGVRIIGPFREYDQVELSHTDGYALDLALPVRLSGDIADTQPITLVGPVGVVTLKEGAIRAARHIHVNIADVGRYQVKNGQKVDVEVAGPGGVIFKEVIVRISPNGKLACHLDTDEGNAAGIRGTGFCRILC
ncbi:MAG TPA: phosphate propanoyltransferase [Atribacteraceae bacterium]|nr:phosphate propanoyltransferase [Atribacteraceae bacterium]